MPRELRVVGAAFFLSGASALVYQVSWQRILALHTGVGSTSIALIVGAFMAGLGIGSQLGGWLSRGMGARGALLGFGLLETAIAVFGVLSVPLYYDLLYLRAFSLYAVHWQAGALHFLSLLVPTVLMGMSLPFLTRAMVATAESAGRTIGMLYALNLLGAGVGALLTPWVLLRGSGLPGAVWAAAGGNALAGLAALALGRLRAPGDPPPSPTAPGALRPSEEHSFLLWLALYTLSGFCALSLEILWFRMLDVATRSSAFTFGTLLALYLLGCGVGCMIGATGTSRLRRPLRTFLLCQCLLLLYSGVMVALVAHLPADAPGYRWFFRYWASGQNFVLGREWDIRALAYLYLWLPLAMFGLPTVLMGLSFPALQRAVQDDPRTSGFKVGALQAGNILGCVAGSLLVGLLLVSWLGTSGSMRLLMACGVAFAGVGWLTGQGRVFGALGAGLAALSALLPGQQALWLRLHGARAPTVLVEEDATGVGAVLPWGSGAWHVVANGKHHSWLPFGGVHTRLGAIPVLVHPAPRDVAIIGLGSGDTAWAAACRPETRSLTVFEISGPQHRLLTRVAAQPPLADLERFLGDPRLRVKVADGRNALLRDSARYDVIEADALWPYSAQSGNLYSVEFFRQCAQRLKPGGVMCTWAPTARTVASFREVFPHVLSPRRHSVLVGSSEPLTADRDGWRARLETQAVREYLGRERAASVLQLLERMEPLPPQGPVPERELNRDLFPRDEFLSP